MFNEQVNAAVTRTELDSVFYQNFEYADSTPEMATAQDADIFPVTQTDGSGIFYEVYGGVPLFVQTGETNQVANSTPKVANKVFVQVLDWTQSVYLSKDMFDDNRHDVWSRTIADLARKGRITQDYNAFGLFRGGFTTTLTADGIALFGAHTLIFGGTTTNFISGASSALSDTSLYTGMVGLRQQPDQRGVPMGNVPKVLLVPSALFKLALQLTDSALVADTANNAINVYRSTYGFKVKTSIWLDAVNGGSDTAWFLLAQNHGIRRLVRQGIETAFRDWSYSDNRTYFYQANFRESYYAQDYGGSYAAKGV